MSGLRYSVSISYGRKWGVRCQWLGWRRIFSISIVTNFMAPAIGIIIGSLSIGVGRIPKKTVLSGKEIFEERKE